MSAQGLRQSRGSDAKVKVPCKWLTSVHLLLETDPKQIYTTPMENKVSSLVPEKEVQRRTSYLQAKLGECDLRGCLILDKINIFYYSGTMQNGTLFVTLVSVCFRLDIPHLSCYEYDIQSDSKGNSLRILG
jgi:hypothetical protein